MPVSDILLGFQLHMSLVSFEFWHARKLRKEGWKYDTYTSLNKIIKLNYQFIWKLQKSFCWTWKKNFDLSWKKPFSWFTLISIHFHALIIWAFKTWDCSSVICLSINGITSLFPSPFSFGLFTVRQKLQTSRRLDIFRFRIVYTCFLFPTFSLQLTQLPLTDARSGYIVHIFV